jgi:hypothetical protein
MNQKENPVYVATLETEHRTVEVVSVFADLDRAKVFAQTVAWQQFMANDPDGEPYEWKCTLEGDQLYAPVAGSSDECYENGVRIRALVLNQANY